MLFLASPTPAHDHKTRDLSTGNFRQLQRSNNTTTPKILPTSCYTTSSLPVNQIRRSIQLGSLANLHYNKLFGSSSKCHTVSKHSSLWIHIAIPSVCPGTCFKCQEYYTEKETTALSFLKLSLLRAVCTSLANPAGQANLTSLKPRHRTSHPTRSLSNTPITQLHKLARVFLSRLVLCRASFKYFYTLISTTSHALGILIPTHHFNIFTHSLLPTTYS